MGFSIRLIGTDVTSEYDYKVLNSEYLSWSRHTDCFQETLPPPALLRFASLEQDLAARKGYKILMHQFPTLCVRVSREQCAFVGVYSRAVVALLADYSLRHEAWVERIFALFLQCESTPRTFIQYNN